MRSAVAVAESTEVQLLQVHAFVADADVADVVDVADLTGAPMGFTSLMSLISLMLPKEMHHARCVDADAETQKLLLQRMHAARCRC